jgi:hypothetical protein
MMLFSWARVQWQGPQCAKHAVSEAPKVDRDSIAKPPFPELSWAPYTALTWF